MRLGMRSQALAGVLRHSLHFSKIPVQDLQIQHQAWGIQVGFPLKGAIHAMPLYAGFSDSTVNHGLNIFPAGNLPDNACPLPLLQKINDGCRKFGWELVHGAVAAMFERDQS